MAVVNDMFVTDTEVSSGNVTESLFLHPSISVITIVIKSKGKTLFILFLDCFESNNPEQEFV